jgi:hypothetical protein
MFFSQKILSQVMLLGTLAGSLTVLSGCETAEDKAISSGQACIDSARTPAAAQVCLNTVASYDSASANLIKCSASYIKQGFTASRFADAFQRLNENPTGGTGGQPIDTMGTSLSFLAFSTQTDADQTYTYCEKSGVRSLLRLAAASKTATTMFVLAQSVSGAGCDPAAIKDKTPAQIAACMSGLQSSGTDKTALGSAAIAMQSSYCNAGSSYTTTDVCLNLNAAITAGGGNLTTIANALLAQLQI